MVLDWLNYEIFKKINLLLPGDSTYEEEVLFHAKKVSGYVWNKDSGIDIPGYEGIKIYDSSRAKGDGKWGDPYKISPTTFLSNILLSGCSVCYEKNIFVAYYLQEMFESENLEVQSRYVKTRRAKKDGTGFRDGYHQTTIIILYGEEHIIDWGKIKTREEDLGDYDEGGGGNKIVEDVEFTENQDGMIYHGNK